MTSLTINSSQPFQTSNCAINTTNCQSAQIIPNQASSTVDSRAIQANPDLLSDAIDNDQVASLKLKVYPQGREEQKVIVFYTLKNGQRGQFKLNLNDHYQLLSLQRIQDIASRKRSEGKIEYSSQQKGQSPLKTILNIVTWSLKALYNLTLAPIFNAMSTSFNLDAGRTLNNLVSKLAIGLIGLGGLGAALFFGMKKLGIMPRKSFMELKNPITNKEKTEGLIKGFQEKLNSLFGRFKSIFQQKPNSPSTTD